MHIRMSCPYVTGRPQRAFFQVTPRLARDPGQIARSRTDFVQARGDRDSLGPNGPGLSRGGPMTFGPWPTQVELPLGAPGPLATRMIAQEAVTPAGGGSQTNCMINAGSCVAY
jgi:hypothetical protein